MNLTRREFLAGVAVAGGLTGCDIRSAPWQTLGVPDELTPFAVAASSSVEPATHVLNRLAFGPRPGDLERVRAMGVDAYIEEQLHPEKLEDPECDRRIRRLETLRAPIGLLFEFKPEFLLDELSRAAVLRATYSRRQLHEVMVEFWTDHFNVFASKGDCQWLQPAYDREVIRAHAFGRFRDLIRATTLSPAMLWYLDVRANRKVGADDRPNENYARELLELHTLGVDGGYTQRDVMESARCLTGWTVQSEQAFGKGNVEFHPEWHDDGEKAVLGVPIPAGEGTKDLGRLLDVVCKHPSTSQHIAAKLCRHFIADAPPVEAVETVREAFVTSDGDTRDCLRALFNTRAFRESAGAKFKRPFRFAVSALRVSDAETDGGAAIQDCLLRMGHAPYQCPTPDGYADEAAPWMGSLLWRWHFALALAENRLPGTKTDWPRLEARAGGPDYALAHCFGRRPAPLEVRCAAKAGSVAALAIGAPAFQWH